MSKTFRKAAMSTICMLIVAVMSLTGATYAWFTQGDSAMVDSMSMEIVTAAGGLEVSSNNTDWKNTLTLDTKKTSVNPVSTVDAVNFVALKGYNPDNTNQIEVTNTVKIDGSDVNVKTAYVIEEVMYLRNTGVEEITIDLRNTYISDYANKTDGSETGTKTAIGKAARIAIFEGTGVEAASATWTLVGIIAPYYDGTTLTDATADSAFNGVKADAVGNGFFTFGETGTYVAATEKTTNADGVEIKLPGLDGNVPQSKMIKVVVWLEGQDIDCSNPNAGGAFATHLQFNKTDAVITTVDGKTNPAN